MITWFKTHKYSLWLLYFVFYFPAFFILERCNGFGTLISCPIDNIIPFNEWFIFPYFLWYITMPGSLLLFMFKDREDFLRLCFLMFGGMTIAIAVYFVFPNGLNLRPETVPDNIAGKICGFLYTIDTPTNVCPSIHVSSAVATDMAIQKSNTFKNNMPVRIISFVIMVLISLSTMFVKQHSIVDALAGFVLSLVLFVIAYYTPFKNIFNKQASKSISA